MSTVGCIDSSGFGVGFDLTDILRRVLGWAVKSVDNTPTIPANYKKALLTLEPVLTAQSLHELEAELERCFPVVMSGLLGLKTSGPIEEVTFPEAIDLSPGEPLLAVMSYEEDARRVMASLGTLFRTAPALKALNKAVSKGEAAELVTNATRIDPNDLYSGKPVPLDIVEALIDVQKGIVAIAAIVVAAMVRQPLDAWLAKSLSEHFQQGSQQLAWYVATLGYPPRCELYRPAGDLQSLYAEALQSANAFEESVRAEIRAEQV